MEIKNEIVIFAIIVIIIGGYVVYSIPLDKETIPVKFFLSNKTGVDASNSQLNFGAITPNHSSVRTITIENTKEKRVNIIIKVSKEISQNIIVSENNFQLEPFTLKNITFTVFTNGLEEFREYNGEIIIISKRAW